jgi:hypothetical protein
MHVLLKNMIFERNQIKIDTMTTNGKKRKKASRGWCGFGAVLVRFWCGFGAVGAGHFLRILRGF